MTVDKAGLASVAELAELNRQLIEDEGHPNPMTMAELAERMAVRDRRTCRNHSEESSGGLRLVGPGLRHRRT